MDGTDRTRTGRHLLTCRTQSRPGPSKTTRRQSPQHHRRPAEPQASKTYVTPSHEPSGQRCAMGQRHAGQKQANNPGGGTPVNLEPVQSCMSNFTHYRYSVSVRVTRSDHERGSSSKHEGEGRTRTYAATLYIIVMYGTCYNIQSIKYIPCSVYQNIYDFFSYYITVAYPLAGTYHTRYIGIYIRSGLKYKALIPYGRAYGSGAYVLYYRILPTHHSAPRQGQAEARTVEKYNC